MRFLGMVLQRITILLRVAWLLLPALIFLLLLFISLWQLGQGEDVLILTLENLAPGKIGWLVLIALLFWVIVTWYSSRVLIYRKSSLHEDSKTIGFHVPRLLGFIAFSILWVAILRLKVPETNHLPTLKNKNNAWIWLAISVAAYFILYYLFKWLRDKWLLPEMHKSIHKDISAVEEIPPPTAEGRREQKLFAIIYSSIGFLVLVLLLVNYSWSGPAVFFWSVIIAQLLFLFLVVFRRGRLPFANFPQEVDKQEWLAQWRKHKYKWEFGFVGKLLYHVNMSLRERIFFYVFNVFSLVAVFFYARAILDLDYANAIGSLPLVLLAFGVLVGFFAFVSVVSLIKKINFHFVLLVLMIIFSTTREPHYARQTNAVSPDFLFVKSRPDLKTYFKKWVDERKDSIMASKEYPMLFVLSDGGASRSGYWVAAALGKLEDSSAGKFSSHLFCLSGASGGVVGQGVFFSFLEQKDSMVRRSYEQAAKDYLRNDFLSFTLVRMLGPDFFRPLLPVNLKKMKDRAGALEKTLESAAPDFAKLDRPFSLFVEKNNDSLRLPIFCINTTRMQDGRPGVITNININNSNRNVRDSAFGPRLDVMRFMSQGKDLRLSTALILASRFPYISPAGRIDETTKSFDTTTPDKDSLVNAHYFVDGGYFDNSGAGIVHEMLLELEEIRIAMMKDSAQYKFLEKLNYYVVHITNGPLGNRPIKEVSAVSNDFFAPLTTLVGAYGTQTTVNDLRLRKHLQLLYKSSSDTQFYRRIDLYKGINADTLQFPLDWTISNFYRNKMDTLLKYSWQTGNLYKWMRTFK